FLRRYLATTPPTPSAPKVRKPLLSEGGAGCHDCDGYQDEGVFCPTCGTDHSEGSSAPSAPVVDDAMVESYQSVGGKATRLTLEGGKYEVTLCENGAF